MTFFNKPSVFVIFIWISSCSSKLYERDYSNGSGGNGGDVALSGPFGGGSRGSGSGFGGPISNDGTGNGNRVGVNPFASMANGANAGKGGSPFASATGTGDGKESGGIGIGPFSSGMNNAGSGASYNGISGGLGNSGVGMGAGPFSGGAAGHGNNNGASPFTATMGNGGGGGGSGAGPFAGAVSEKGSSPFNANMDSNGGMPGVDLSSLMKSGPGGLAGGNFLPSNASTLMGHDFSKDLGENGGQFGETSLGQGEGENQFAIDNSRFDTTAYQQMLQQLFSTDTSGQELKDLGTPFDGSSYNYNSNSGKHFNTAVEGSVGSFASTDMSSYSGNNGQFQALQKGNVDQYTGSGSSSYSDGSNSVSSESGNDGTHASPFNLNNYDMGHASPYSGGAAGVLSGSDMNKGQNPFDINNYSTGKNPFSIDNNNNGAGSTSGNSAGASHGPFDTSKFGVSTGNEKTSSGSGQNPFDASKYQASGAFSDMMGNQQYQNMGSGSVDYNSGLDEYGNVNFGTLSGLSGNPVDAASSGGLGGSGLLSETGSYSANPQGSSSYSGFPDGTRNGQYRAENTGTGSKYSGTGTGYNAGSDNKYNTPFEADNYNDLLGNPFRSDSYFDTTRQNFKLPYETNSNLQQISYSNSGSSSGYDANRFIGSGPAGDPFHQGGNSMTASNAMRG